MWWLAMLCIMPLVCGNADKLRTWLALAFAAGVVLVLPEMDVRAYILTDALAGFIVLRSPKGWAQRLIGGVFSGMVLFHIGYLWGGSGDPVLYATIQNALGWGQFACLATWGALSAGETILDRAGRLICQTIAVGRG